MLLPVTLLGPDSYTDAGTDIGLIDRRLDLDLETLDRQFRHHADPTRMVQWLVETFPVDQIVLASAMAAPVLVDVVSKVIPGIEVVFLDTGYHFDETLRTVDAVAERYPIRLTVTAAPPIGDEQYLTDPDGCCNRRKVVPFQQVRSTKAAWISGVRRSDAATRASTPFVQRDRQGLIKLNPIAAWTDADVATYAAIHDVPLNPLMSQGYPSIGCWPCTRRPLSSDDARSGRWADQAKTECGLHL